MFKWVGKVLGGDANEQELKKLWPIAEDVIALESEIQALSDDELRAKTDKLSTKFEDWIEKDFLKLNSWDI